MASSSILFGDSHRSGRMPASTPFTQIFTLPTYSFSHDIPSSARRTREDRATAMRYAVSRILVPTKRPSKRHLLPESVPKGSRPKFDAGCIPRPGHGGVDHWAGWHAAVGHVEKAALPPGRAGDQDTPQHKTIRSFSRSKCARHGKRAGGELGGICASSTA